ncbi:flagellar protein YvyF [Halobacillus fulvus]|nr:flagellar protein YvyF [Halobacillus fulvus]
MGELANCPRCHAIFMKGAATVCPACKKKEEQDFQTVYAFLRKKQNRTATVQEISAKTDVEEKQIRQFVAQKRLHPAQFPNLSYDCEKCGTSITEGRLCQNCSQDIEKGLKQLQKNEGLENRKLEREREKARTYYSLKNEQ